MTMPSRHVIVYLLLGVAALFLYTHETVAVPVSKPLAEIPVQLDEWAMISQARFDPDILAKLKPTDYLYRVYRDTAGHQVALYLGYHSGGKDSGPIHSPRHCLPGNGWLELSELKRNIPLAEGTLPFVQALYQNDRQKEIFIYYYQVKGWVLTDEYSLKIAEIVNSILYNRRDSAFIRISVAVSDDQPEEAAMIGERFLVKIHPQIVSVLPM